MPFNYSSVICCPSYKFEHIWLYLDDTLCSYFTVAALANPLLPPNPRPKPHSQFKHDCISLNLRIVVFSYEKRDTSAKLMPLRNMVRRQYVQGGSYIDVCQLYGTRLYEAGPPGRARSCVTQQPNRITGRNVMFVKLQNETK